MTARAFARAASTLSSCANATPNRRCPTTSGLANNRKSVSGSANASATPSKRICRELPLTNKTHDAVGLGCRITGIGKPKIARACRLNSDRFCDISVTKPVSCGRGETSLNHTLSPLTKNSMPNTPQPPRSFATASAMRSASASAFADIACGCHDSR